MAVPAVRNAKKTARKRPAETVTAVAAAIATLVALVFRIDDPAAVAAIAVVVGAVPSVVTWAASLKV